MQRPNNEDSFYCSRDEKLAIVADGMGGHACGEVASAIAVRVIRDTMLSALDGREKADQKLLCDTMRESLDRANELIHRKTLEQGSRATKMGTTVAMFAAHGDASAVAHVGDSRVYLLRGAKMFRLTQDHSLVNEQLKAELITEEEAKKSVYRHIVTRALGMKEAVESDTQELSVREGDRLLLCSDGLFDLVEDELIEKVIRNSEGNRRDAVHNLIDLANSRGGDDNVTVVLVEIASVPGQQN